MIASFQQMLHAFLPLIKNTGSTIIIRGLSGITRIVILLLITRQFGPVEFGRLALVISVTEIFKIMADTGLDIITIRRFSLHRRLSPRIMDNVLSLKLMTATAGFFLSTLAFWVLYRSVDGLILTLIISLSIYTTLIINAFLSYFQARLKTADVIVSNIISASAYAALTLIGMYYHLPLEIFALMIPASELINLVLTGRVYRQFEQIHLRFNKKIILSLLRESLPSGISGLIVVVYLRMDNLMIGKLIGEQGVGVYSTAFRLTEPFLLLFTSLSFSLYATLSKFRTVHDLSEAKRSFLTIIMPTIGVSFLFAVILSTFSSEIVGILPASYKASGGVLMILSWSIFFKATNSQLTAFINSRAQYRLMMAISIFNLLIAVACNLLLIPRYGIKGAAGAVVITEGVNMLIQVACVHSLSRAALPGPNIITQRK
jgi:O-antigen/teichoic acid export membrane protein